MGKKIQLTDNFALKEFVVSSDHPEIAAKIKLDQEQENRCRLQAESILQPLRNEWAGPKDAITILSSVRNEQLNSAVGGSMNSDHLYAVATDFTSNNLLEKYLYLYYNHFPYRQLIYYPDQNFIHVSINAPGRCFKHEALVKYKKNKKYLPFKGGRIPVIKK